MAKTLIYYHRAYRKITGSGWKVLVELTAIGLMLSLLFLFVYPDLTKAISFLAHNILSRYYPAGTVQIFNQPFLFGKIFFVGIPGKYPSYTLSVVNLAISMGLVIFLPHVKRYKNIAIFFTYIAAVNMASAAFFTLSFSEFPYSIKQFSELYMKTQINMWLFLPFILSMAILLFPAYIFPKLALILATLVYSIVFGTLRYIIFLFILSKFSIIYMALLFFSFGPLIDFVYIVGIYSYYGSRLAKNLRTNRSVWKWSF